MINSLEGFSRVTPGMVLTWKRPKVPSLKKMGRQVDRDFELEVLRECEKASNNHMQNGGSSKDFYRSVYLPFAAIVYP